jgi:hypothetical protein
MICYRNPTIFRLLGLLFRHSGKFLDQMQNYRMLYLCPIYSDNYLKRKMHFL